MKLARPRFPVSAGRTPAGATLLASVQSPPLVDADPLTNTPSDNYLAETLLKDIGARLGGAGTTAAGAAVVRAELLSKFGISPRLNDGSGLSRYDLTSPPQVVTVLKAMATNSAFVDSLARGRRDRHARRRDERDASPRATAAARPARCTTSRTSPATARAATATRWRSRSWPTASATPTTCTRSRPAMAVALAKYNG